MSSSFPLTQSGSRPSSFNIPLSSIGLVLPPVMVSRVLQVLFKESCALSVSIQNVQRVMRELTDPLSVVDLLLHDLQGLVASFVPPSYLYLPTSKVELVLFLNICSYFSYE